MIIKTIVDEDFVNYKKPSMFIAFPKCNWKCEQECGIRVCQNSTLAAAPDITKGVKTIVARYINNPITSAIVCGGLEPFDTWEDLYELITYLRIATRDDIVIYTGYYEEEIREYVNRLKIFSNIIIKYGRYIPNQKSHYDKVLGIHLASDNQYAEKVS